MKASRILVVIPTLNERPHIEACIRSLFDTSMDTHSFDVVVSDGGSEDGTTSIVEQLKQDIPNITLLHNHRRIQSAGINLAVHHCATPDHKILIRCDAHAIYPRNFISDLVRTLEQTQAQSVVIPMDSKGKNAFSKAAAWIADTRIGSGGAKHRGGKLSGYIDHGHHAAFDMNWFRKAGGYDTEFSHNEDAELDYRLTQMGAKIWMEATIRVDYFMRSNFNSLARQYWNYGRGRCRTVCKHNVQLKRRQTLPIANFVAVASCLFLSNFNPAFLVFPLAYLATLALCSVVSAYALRSFSGLWAGPALFAMHNYWAAGYAYAWIAHRKRRKKIARPFPRIPTL